MPNTIRGSGPNGQRVQINDCEAAEDSPFLLQRMVVITHEDLTNAVAGASQTFELAPYFGQAAKELPPGSVVVAHEVGLEAQFTGGGVGSLVVSLGSAANPIGIVEEFDAQGSAAPAAYTPNTGSQVQGGYGGLGPLVATVTPDMAHALADLTAGEIALIVWFFVV